MGAGPEDKTMDMAAQAKVSRSELEFEMKEELDIRDITAELVRVIAESGMKDGLATVFVPGATGAVTCLEYEPGVIADFKAAVERAAPRDMHYDHNVYQSDGNGHGHVRAGLLGPSLTIPVAAGEPVLGVWQQVVLVNCDNRSRRRRVVIQLVGA
jgi:secondary thiamine-phosphate synthase enzyme